MARPACGLVSVQHRLRNSARLSVELHRGNDAVWSRRMALEAGHPGGTRHTLPALPFWNSAQSPLAGQETKDCGSKRRAPADGRGELRQELQEIIVSIDADHVAND